MKGQYVDILAWDIPLLENPVIEKGTPRILLDVSKKVETGSPALLFASHRCREETAGKGRIEFIVEGPERIPTVARLFPGNRQLKSLSCELVNTDKKEDMKIEHPGDDPWLIQFQNREGGVRVCAEFN